MRCTNGVPTHGTCMSTHLRAFRQSGIRIYMHHQSFSTYHSAVRNWYENYTVGIDILLSSRDPAVWGCAQVHEGRRAKECFRNIGIRLDRQQGLGVLYNMCESLPARAARLHPGINPKSHCQSRGGQVSWEVQGSPAMWTLTIIIFNPSSTSLGVLTPYCIHIFTTFLTNTWLCLH